MATTDEAMIDIDAFDAALDAEAPALPRSLVPPRVRKVSPASKPNSGIVAPKREGTDRAERRHRRYPFTDRIELCVMAGDRPLPEPFVVTGLDISRSGLRVVGAAPLLAGASVAMILERKDGQRALVGGVVRHSGCGSAALMDGKGNCAAGIEFAKLDQNVINRWFTADDGSVTLPRK